MKIFTTNNLRRIFLLLAVMATGVNTVWGECYIISDSSEQTRSWLSGAGVVATYNLSGENNCIVTFSAKTSATTTSNAKDITLQQTTDGINWSNVQTFSITKDYKTYSCSNLNSSAKAIRFSVGGAYDRSVKNVYVAKASLLSVNGVYSSSNPFDFGTIPSGTTIDKTITISYQNIGNSIVSTNGSFAVVGSTIDECNSSSADITIRFAPTSVGANQTGTLTIEGSNGTSTTLYVKGSASAIADPSITWSGQDSYSVEDGAIDLDNVWTSNSSGSITYSMSFTPDNVGEIGATAPTLNSSNVLTLGQAGTLHLSLTQVEAPGFNAITKTKDIRINKNVPSISWTGYTYYYNSNYNNVYSVTAGEESLMTLTSSDADVAGVDGKNVTTYNKVSSTTLTVTAVESYKWAGATFTKNITPAKANNHVAFTLNTAAIRDALFSAKASDGSISCDNSGTISLTQGGVAWTANPLYYTIKFEGIPDKLSFSYKQGHSTSTAIGSTKKSFIVYQSANGSAWTEVWTSNGATSDEKTRNVSNLQLNPETRYLKFFFDGTYDGYYSNISVSELVNFKSDKASLDFATNKLNVAPAVQSFTVNHANAGYQTSVTAPTHYQVSLDGTNFASSVVYSTNDTKKTGGDKMGTFTVYVKYLADAEGTHAGNVVVSNNLRADVSVSVTGTTQSKVATHIVWTGKPDSEEYSEADGTLANPFKVYDANNNEIVGAVVTYTSSNSYIAQVNNDGTFSPYCGGDITLTATYAGNESYQGCTDTKTIHVALCEPTLVWNQSFTRYSTSDVNTSVELNAVITQSDGTPFEGVVYSYGVGNPAVASLDGTNTMTIRGEGETILTMGTNEVTNAHGQKFAPLTATRVVHVRAQGSACNSTLLDYEDLIKVGQWFMDPAVHGPDDPMDLEIADGEKDMLTFKVWKYNAATKHAYLAFLDKNKNRIGDPIEYSVSSLSSSEPSSPNKTIDMKTEALRDAKYLRFYGEGTVNKYFKDIKITQQSYLRSSVSGFNEQWSVCEAFEKSVTISYSDKPELQLSVTANSANQGSMLSATFDRVPDNDCGQDGTYILTITGYWDSQLVVDQVVHITTTAGDDLQIPVRLDIRAGAAWHFNMSNGEWNTSTQWTVGSQVQSTLLPNAANEVYIDNMEVTITEKVSAYSVYINGTVGKIIIAPGAGLTVGAGGITGATKDNLILQADKEHGTAYLRISPKYMGAMPQATVEMYSKAYYDQEHATSAKDAVWQYIGCPIAKDENAPTVENIFSGSWLKVWNSATQSWNTPSSSAKMTPFLSYLCTQSENNAGKQFNYSGKLLKDNKTWTLTNTGSEDKYYVYANSYTAPIDLSSIDMNEVFSGEIDRTIYLFNSASYNEWQSTTTRDGDGRGQYTAIPAGNAVEIAKMKGEGKSVLIPSMQGFMLICPAGKSGSFTFDYNSMIWKSDYSSLGSGVPMRVAARHSNEELSTDSTSARLSFQLSSNSHVSEMFAIERPEFTNQFDNGYDARYMAGDVSLGLYFNVQGEKYSFHSTDNVAGTYLGFNAGEDSLHTLTFNYVETAEPLYLQDMLTDSIIVVEQGASYRFYCSNAATDALRFRLLNEDMLPADYWTGNGGEANPGMTTDITATESSALMWLDGDVVYSVAEGASTIALYDLNGRLIMTRSFCNMGSLSLANLPAGIYMAQSGSRLLKIVR